MSDKVAPEEARALLSSLVLDFKERIVADQEWNEEGYDFPEAMPRWTGKKMDFEGVSPPPAEGGIPSESPALQPPPQSPTSLAPEASREAPLPQTPEVHEMKTEIRRPQEEPIVAVLPPAQEASRPAENTEEAPPKDLPNHYVPVPAAVLGNGPKPGTDGTPALLREIQKGQAGLDQIAARMKNPALCSLSEALQEIIFGEGNPDAELILIGEAPERGGDSSAKPFSGPGGELLDKMIGAMGYTREDVFCVAVAKYHPGSNRELRALEQFQCRPYLVAQIEAVNPRVVISFGKLATQTLLETDERISRLRGRMASHPHSEIPVMPTYHPADLLRTPHLKRPVWEDLQKVMALLSPSS